MGAIGVDQERRVIGRAVVLARTGAAIVAAAALQALAVKLFHGVVVLGAEGDVGAVRFPSLVQMQPERRLALRAKAGIAVAAGAEHEAERSEHGGVEARAGVEIGNADSDVVVHGRLHCKSRRLQREPETTLLSSAQ